jgi:hypothetical protein
VSPDTSSPYFQHLFDPEGAKAARDEAMERAETHAATTWKDKAMGAIYRACRMHASFTSEDLWKAGLAKPAEPRALGPMMTAAARKGWCESSGTYVKGSAVSRHGAPIAVWNSKLYWVS